MSKKSYVCGVDYQHEIGETNDITLFSSIKALKKNKICWKECGIVELEISVKKWIYPQDLEIVVEKTKTK